MAVVYLFSLHVHAFSNEARLFVHLSSARKLSLVIIWAWVRSEVWNSDSCIKEKSIGGGIRSIPSGCHESVNVTSASWAREYSQRSALLTLAKDSD